MKKNVCVLLSVLGIAVLNGTGSTPGWAKSAGASAPAASLGQQQPLEALLDTTARQVEQGDFDQASATLERALRIAPHNALVWHLLGQVRMHQARYKEAIAMADKSNGFTGKGDPLREQNAHLINVARQLATTETSGGQTSGGSNTVALTKQAEKESLLINIRKAQPQAGGISIRRSQPVAQDETNPYNEPPRTRPSAQELIDRLHRQSRQQTRQAADLNTYQERPIALPRSRNPASRVAFDAGFDAPAGAASKGLVMHDLGGYSGRLYPVNTSPKTWP
ncbi:MAG: tetratricopeptide repeat protein [Gammaproteobacteria bacterium]